MEEARVCIGWECQSVTNFAKSELDWRTALNRIGKGQEPPGCPPRLHGCPWQSCGTQQQKCAVLGQEAPTSCPSRGVQPHRSPCFMMPSSQWLPRQQRKHRAASCSGSLGEEGFALHRFFGGRNGAVRHGGSFLELGAYDGWMESNTLHLEQCLGWRGVLIEGHPTHASWLRGNRPAAISLGVAICPQRGHVNFTVRPGTTAGIPSLMDRGVRSRFRLGTTQTAPVPCGPLGDWLAMLSMRSVDLFVLDVQGAELLVLSSLRWADISIGVLVVECKRLGCADRQDAAVFELVERRGLRWAGMLRARHDIWDAVFVNASHDSLHAAMNSSGSGT